MCYDVYVLKNRSLTGGTSEGAPSGGENSPGSCEVYIIEEARTCKQTWLRTGGRPLANTLMAFSRWLSCLLRSRLKVSRPTSDLPDRFRVRANKNVEKRHLARPFG